MKYKVLNSDQIKAEGGSTCFAKLYCPTVRANGGLKCVPVTRSINGNRGVRSDLLQLVGKSVGSNRCIRVCGGFGLSREIKLGKTPLA